MFDSTPILGSTAEKNSAVSLKVSLCPYSSGDRAPPSGGGCAGSIPARGTIRTENRRKCSDLSGFNQRL